MTDSKRNVLTIIVDETEVLGEMPLYEAVVRKLVKLELAGATVYMGIMGFGRHGKVHRKRLFGVADERPVSIVVIDRDEPIRRALPEIRAMLPEGLMYLTEAELV